jgi:hypothetical protein
VKLFLHHIVRLHGFPETIISDRGPQFVSAFWKHFWNHFDTSPKLSTSFHPQTNGNTEIVNKLVIQYLRIYAHDNPSSWSQHLPLAESSYNNSFHTTIQSTPFFATYGFHPRFDNLSVPPSSSSPFHVQTHVEHL